MNEGMNKGINMNLPDIALFTTEIAIEAGQLIKAERDAGTVNTSYKAQHELVTSADIAADKLIIARIKERFPEHRILSEETYTDRSQVSNLVDPIWIIDPIDGTVNYAHGHFMVAVSIAFAVAGEVQVGVVYNPFLDELFCAHTQGGATLNAAPIQVSTETQLNKALIATGFPYNKSTVPEIVARVEVALMHCQDIRRLGSAALDICWVACGRLEGYFESLSPWDFAAARLIAQEAGAKCGHFNPVPDGIPACIYGEDILIANKTIYAELDKILQ